MTRVLRSGWKASGLVPWNPGKGLNSSQVLEPFKRPSTPPESALRSGTTLIPISTSKSTWEIHETTRSIKRMKTNEGAWERLAAKAGKAIAMGNAQRARDLETIRAQEVQISRLSAGSTRKRVTFDPNTRFSSIEQIKQAQAEQKAHEELLATRQPELEAKRASQALLNIVVNRMVA